jgi:DNA-binding GntR family transcriptional regulator
MGQSSVAKAEETVPPAPDGRSHEFSLFGDAESLSAVERVAHGVIQALEQRKMSPGQRLVEKDLVAAFGVGRNTVREAIQWLAARGLVDAYRNRSSVIRALDFDEAIEVLEVAEMLTGLVGRAAARRYDPDAHGMMLQAVMDDITEWEREEDSAVFGTVRRRFLGTLLHIGANRELKRVFASVNMTILYAQLQTPAFRKLRAASYRAICKAVMRRNQAAAESAGRAYVAEVRELMISTRGGV